MTRPAGGGAAAASAALERSASARTAGAWRGGWAQGLSYGALGLPLAFVALPLYVILPNHYATAFGIPLATLGALLLGARLFDAVTDPFIGRFVDRWFDHSARRVLLAVALSAGVLAAGFRGLFFPPGGADGALTGAALLWWCGALLAITYLSFSIIAVAHQSWGARLGGDAGQRARIVSWREGLALLGVLVASVLPALAGLSVATVVFAVLLLLAVALLWRAPLPQIGHSPIARAPVPAAAAVAVAAPTTATATATAKPSTSTPAGSSVSLIAPLHTLAFRRLLAIYLVNGVASAVPATLVLFFIRDRLQAQAFEPLFLASYFAAGALSMPLWVRAVARFGLAPTWLAGMVLAILTFAWAALLGAGDVAAYTVVCVASGIALGADLTLPGALLAGVIQRAGHGQRLEGGYFGWWNFATKLNLALAAGIALPVLALFGYSPGSREPEALQALTVAYCLLPCVLKLGAVGLLYVLWIRKENE